MKILALFFLGIVQGLTEFLPVSSSGHIVLFSKLFGIEESLFLSIFLHLATLFSIFVVFYKDILEILKKPFSDKTMKLVTATIPTCVIAKRRNCIRNNAILFLLFAWFYDNIVI